METYYYEMYSARFCIKAVYSLSNLAGPFTPDF
jgi:hypothetical protein